MTSPPPDGSPGIGRIAAATATIVAVVGVAWLLLELSGFLLLVFAAVVLGAVFDVMASNLARRTGLGRGTALTIAIFAVLALFAGVFTLFGTQLADEFDTIRDSIPPALAQLRSLMAQFGLDQSVRAALDSASGDVASYASQAGSYAMTAGNTIANIVIVFVGAIYLAADPGVYRRGLLLLIPKRAEPPVAAAIEDASRGLRGWMLGQAVSSLVVAAFTWAGLALLGVPAAGGLGLIAGLLDVIPMVGPIIAGVPAVLLALTVSPATALWTLGLFLLIQQFQGNVLQPMIQKHAVNVPPALLLFALVAAGVLFGFLGVLLAAPLTVVVYVMVQRLYVRTLLGKDITIAGDD
jgi:predicted PurR-regulated permease PerM